MEKEPEYFSLEQVAEECNLSIEAVKDRLFADDLMSSFQINRPTRVNLVADTMPLTDNDDYTFPETVLVESNALFTGIVSVSSLEGLRNSGRFDGRIEFHPKHWRIAGGSLDNPLLQPCLFHRTESGLLYQLELLESCEIPEDKLIVHRKHLAEFKSKDATETTPTVNQAKKESAGKFSLQEVLPIRFIEFYTGGNLGPETTALFFAHKQGIDWNRRLEAADKLTAYHWQQGKLTPLKRTEWESILHSIKSLTERYDKTDKHFDEWRTAALKILPVAFVRRSEFDAAYRRAMSPERITFLDQSSGFERLTGDEDKEARETNDTPYIPPELRKLVFEGFEQECTTISTEATEQDHVPECKQVPAIYDPVSEAAKALKQHQTAEIDKKVKEIMDKIHCLVKEVVQNRSADRVINHIKVIREAEIPDDKFDSVKKKVAAEIRTKYGDAGFKSLSRRPKVNEPYLLS